MIKTVQFRIYPSVKQKRLINEQLECHRLLYNTVLDDAEKTYEKDKTKISDFDLIKKWVKHFREVDERFKTCNYSSLQHTVRRFGKARTAMIKKRSGKQCCKLRFKPSHRFNSIEYTKGDGIRVKKGRFYIQGVGEVKAFWHTDVPDYNYAILTRRGDSLYVSLCYKYENGVSPNVEEKSIGVDFGIKTFLTLSDGQTIKSPRFYKQDSKQLKKAHGKIHATEKGGGKRKKAVKVVQKINKRIANRRKNFNHQITRQLVNSYSLICLEDLDSTDLDCYAEVNKAIRDLGFGQFKSFLSYKAENAGKKVVFVSPAYTSQKCSNCGDLVPKKLSERTHKCKCGYTEDRDVNAAKNILALGLQSLKEA